MGRGSMLNGQNKNAYVRDKSNVVEHLKKRLQMQSPKPYIKQFANGDYQFPDIKIGTFTTDHDIYKTYGGP